MRTLGFARVVAAAICMAVPAGAAQIVAGNPASECYARFQVGEGGETVATNTVGCPDNDPSGCDGDSAVGSCSFTVALCINQSSDTCTPPGPAAPLKKVKPKGAAKKAGILPPGDLASTDCGSPVTVTVRLKKGGRKSGKVKLQAQAVASTAPKKDKDNVTLKCCAPNDASCTPIPPGSCTGLPDVECPANPNGGPDEMFMRVGNEGTDLDNGWTGIAHNFPVPPCSTLKLCLSGCDASTNPICDATGPTGAGTINGLTFGPPLPLITQSVPVCVINRYQGAVTGRVNVQTGQIMPDQPVQVNLFSDTHFTQTDAVCPRCAGASAKEIGGTGRCDRGPNQGQDCVVESKIDVPLGDGDKTYTLSGTCVPAQGQFAGTLDIRLPLTTEISRLQGPKPCQTGGGVAVQDDNCSGSPCAAQCTGGSCASRDDQGRCIDQKGGISQLCCNNNPTRPCFPTAGGGTIERTGVAAIPVATNGMGWPETTYPKQVLGGALAATFCEGATTTSVINSTTGLPGPGALILPGTVALLKQ